jgi:hypothetical protein
VIKRRRIRRAVYVARIWEERGMYRVWWGNLRKSDHWEDSSIDGRIILGRIFRKWYVVD